MDVDHHALEFIELVDGCECFIIARFICQVGLCVRSGDDGKGSTKRFLHFFVEMISIKAIRSAMTLIMEISLALKNELEMPRLPRSETTLCNLEQINPPRPIVISNSLKAI